VIAGLNSWLIIGKEKQFLRKDKSHLIYSGERTVMHQGKTGPPEHPFLCVLRYIRQRLLSWTQSWRTTSMFMVENWYFDCLYFGKEQISCLRFFLRIILRVWSNDRLTPLLCKFGDNQWWIIGIIFLGDNMFSWFTKKLIFRIDRMWLWLWLDRMWLWKIKKKPWFSNFPLIFWILNPLKPLFPISHYLFLYSFYFLKI
jgi:hypothetical protein